MNGPDELVSFWNEKHRLYNTDGDIHMLTNTSLGQVTKNFKLHQILSTKNTILMIGVGTGKDTKEIVSKGHIVDGYDISEIALSRVKKATRHNYLAQDIHMIPHNEYNLVISHFVAQHMNDLDLRDQILTIMPCLTENGIFAMQFVEVQNPQKQTLYLQKWGGCSRTLERLQELLPKFKINVVNQIQYNKSVNGIYVYICN